MVLGQLLRVSSLVRASRPPLVRPVLAALVVVDDGGCHVVEQRDQDHPAVFCGDVLHGVELELAQRLAAAQVDKPRGVKKDVQRPLKFVLVRERLER